MLKESSLGKKSDYICAPSMFGLRKDFLGHEDLPLLCCSSLNSVSCVITVLHEGDSQILNFESQIEAGHTEFLKWSFYSIFDWLVDLKSSLLGG